MDQSLPQAGTSKVTVTPNSVLSQATLAEVPDLKEWTRRRNHAHISHSLHRLFSLISEAFPKFTHSYREILGATVDQSLSEFTVTSLASKNAQQVQALQGQWSAHRLFTSTISEHSSHNHCCGHCSALGVGANYCAYKPRLQWVLQPPLAVALDPLDESYRLLQRLVAGAGVRQSHDDGVAYVLHERKFVKVLNEFCNAGGMTMEQNNRIVALQDPSCSRAMVDAMI
jgi:hypothetical protein